MGKKDRSFVHAWKPALRLRPIGCEIFLSIFDAMRPTAY